MCYFLRLICISMIFRIVSSLRVKKKEQNLVDATTLTTSKATGQNLSPACLITLSRPRHLSAFSQILMLFWFTLVFDLGQTEASLKTSISRSGDFNLGILIDAYEHGACPSDCSGETQEINLVYPMAAEYYHEIIRQNDTENVGFCVVDTCGRPSAAMHQALAFLPNSLSNTCGNTSKQSNTDVIAIYGVVSTLRPTLAYPAFAALNAAGVPAISMFGIKKLSNRKRYPNLYHYLPNEVYDLEMIPSLLKHNAWYYVSVVHEDSLRFSKTFYKLKIKMELVCKLNASECLCIATSQTLAWNASNSTADIVVNELVKHKVVGANVVVVIASFPVVLKLLNAVNRHSPLVQFVWIATHTWVWHYLDLLDPSVCAHLPNTLLIHPVQTRNKWRYSHSFLERLHSDNVTDLVWYEETLKIYLCKNIEQKECHNEVLKWRENVYRVNPLLLRTFLNEFDILYRTLVKAIRICENIKSSKTYCIRKTHERYLIENKGLQFLQEETATEDWAVISHRGKDNEYVVAEFINNTYIPRDRFTLMAAINDSVSLSPLSSCDNDAWNNIFQEEPLSSGCRPDCKPHEKHVARKPKECCWRCVKCHKNEIVTDNRTRCELCPETKWPYKATNFTTCHSLPVFRPTFSNYWPKSLVFLAVCLITLNLGVVAFFLWNRKERVIKATSLQLSMLMQLGLIIGSVSIIVSCVPASPLICPLSAVLHDLSSSLLLCPLFVRTLLIYRIFRQKRRVTVSMRRWVMLCVLLAVVKPILSLMEWPCPKTSQPNRHETYVELHCEHLFFLEYPKSGIKLDKINIVHWLKTAYTYMITVLCLGIAYQLRHLPSNFNESAFILVCICAEITSMVLIGCGVAVEKLNLKKMYFTNLGFALTLLLYIILLFFTKIYAVLFSVIHYRDRSHSRTTGRSTRFSSVFILQKAHSDIISKLNQENIVALPVPNFNSGHSARKISGQSHTCIKKVTDEDRSVGHVTNRCRKVSYAVDGPTGLPIIAEDSNRMQKSSDHVQDVVGGDLSGEFPDVAREAKVEKRTPGECAERTSDALSTHGLEDEQVTLQTNYEICTENSIIELPKSEECSRADDATNESAGTTPSQAPDMKNVTDEDSEERNLDTVSMQGNEAESLTSVLKAEVHTSYMNL